MIGLGTLINVGTIILGGLLGILCKKVISERLQQALTKAIGVCVLFVGVSGAIDNMFTISETEGLVSAGSLMMILSIVIGTLLGELINIEGGLERFGAFLRRISKSEKDNSFLDGFLTASFTVCIGAMAVIGALNDGLNKDYSLLIIKSILDFVTVLVLSSTMGKGCIFSAIPVLIFQGLITLLARVVGPVMTELAITNLGIVGSVLIFCVGLNLVWGKKIKVANMLPALIFAIAFAYVPYVSGI